MTHNRIEVVHITFEQLATNEAKRIEFKNALNEFGVGDWEPVQFEQVGQTMLVFMSKKG